MSQLLPTRYTIRSEVARPRACVKIYPGGFAPQVFGIKSFSIDKNCHGATNTASFILPYAGNPDWTNLLFRGDGATVLDNLPIYVEIWAGFPTNPSMNPDPGELSRRFYGIIDMYEAVDSDQTEFHCRSIAAPLCTDRITTAVQNLTTAQFLQMVAGQYNIPTDIDPALVNPYTLADVYGQTFVVGLRQLIKWSVLLDCAMSDDVDLWEDDGTIHYRYPWTIARQRLPLVYGTNVKAFKGTHSPQFNRNIEVFVHGYTQTVRRSAISRVRTHVGADGPGVDVTTNSKTSTRVPQWGTNEATTTTYYSNGDVSVSTESTSGGPSSGSTSAISESGKEKYYFRCPNHDAQKCEDFAKKKWRQISMHEYQCDFTIAMTPELLPLVGITSLVDFSGYGMGRFNSKYWPRTLRETFEGAEPGSNDARGWTATLGCATVTPPVGGV